MIQYVNVSKSYTSKSSQVVSLENISFEIDDGEFVFLIGPSGAGKTTLIRLLIREELPTEGTIYFDNEDITKFNRKQIYTLRRKIGVIFQDYKLIDDKTAYENVAFVMEAAGKSEKEIIETVPYLLDIVGLADRQEAFPPELSGGEKQRVAIARALANNPKVLIADEPTGNLDPDAAWDIVQILKKINDWGTTVIMSTHGSEIVNKVGKRVIRMENGVVTRDDKSGGTYKTNGEKTKEEFETKIRETHDDGSTKLTTGKKEEPVGKEEIKEEKATDPETSSEEVKVEIKKDEEKEKEVIPVELEVKEEETTEETAKDSETNSEKKEEKIEEKKEEKKVEPKAEVKEEKIEEVVEEVKTEETKNGKKPKFKISLVHKKNKKDSRNDSDIAVLVLPPKILKILEDNDYKDINKLVDAGIEKIAKIKEFTPNEIEIIRKSIVTYLQSKQ